MVFDRAWSVKGWDEQLAEDKLGALVSSLTRQRWRQLLIENSWLGLFWGLTASTAAVAALKLRSSDFPLATLIALIVGLALLATTVKTWLSRPDKLRVVIQADITLKLKQRLSTAWEFMARGTDPELSRRLAAHAVNQRFPPPSQPVFPLRATTWAKLVPLVGLTLILVSVVDLQRLRRPPAPLVDDVVVSEGVRLREFAKQMQMRAERRTLPRSQAAAEKIRRLGARMESGSLAREQALYRLQDLSEDLSRQRRGALSDASADGTHFTESFAPSGSRDGDATRLRELLQQLLRGRLTAGEMGALQQQAQSLAELGVSSETLQQALDDFAAGESVDLQQMVEELSRMELAMQDADELGRAMDRVEQVRESLGDLIVRAEDLLQSGPDGRAASSDGVPRPLAGELGAGSGEDGPTMMEGRSLGFGSGVTQRQRPQTLDPASQRDDVVLKPRGQFREGAGFTTETRVLPRAGRPTVEAVQLDARFTAQMEDVLAAERYPLHEKEYIRRYFLNLSQGAATESAQTQDRQ